MDAQPRFEQIVQSFVASGSGTPRRANAKTDSGELAAPASGSQASRVDRLKGRLVSFDAAFDGDDANDEDDAL